jgi:hypothetical protein
MITAAAAVLGRRGGAATSAAKQKASRENGKKGGDPRLTRINQTAPGLTLTGLPDLPPDAIGATINGVHYTRAEYEALRAQGRRKLPRGHIRILTD